MNCPNCRRPVEARVNCDWKCAACGLEWRSAPTPAVADPNLTLVQVLADLEVGLPVELAAPGGARWVPVRLLPSGIALQTRAFDGAWQLVTMRVAMMARYRRGGGNNAVRTSPTPPRHRIRVLYDVELTVHEPDFPNWLQDVIRAGIASLTDEGAARGPVIWHGTDFTLWSTAPAGLLRTRSRKGQLIGETPERRQT